MNLAETLPHWTLNESENELKIKKQIAGFFKFERQEIDTLC